MYIYKCLYTHEVIYFDYFDSTTNATVGSCSKLNSITCTQC